jgi:hypothetical protein
LAKEGSVAGAQKYDEVFVNGMENNENQATEPESRDYELGVNDHGR